MANPQAENGYTKIANEIMDALIFFRLPGEQRQILDSILRKTYGFNKKIDAISLSQFVLMTGLKKPNVVRAIQGLLSKKIISVIKSDNKPAHVYEFNKNYDEWEPLSKKITLSKVIISVIKSDNASLSKVIPTKNNTTKDNTTKDIKTIAQKNDFLQFWESYPKKKSKGQAKKTWDKLLKQKVLPDISIILNAIAAQKAGQDWQKDGGKWIPYPASWLNAEGWEDKIFFYKNDAIKPRSVRDVKDLDQIQMARYLKEKRRKQDEGTNANDNTRSAHGNERQLPEPASV